MPTNNCMQLQKTPRDPNFEAFFRHAVTENCRIHINIATRRLYLDYTNVWTLLIHFFISSASFVFISQALAPIGAKFPLHQRTTPLLPSHKAPISLLIVTSRSLAICPMNTNNLSPTRGNIKIFSHSIHEK